MTQPSPNSTTVTVEHAWSHLMRVRAATNVSRLHDARKAADALTAYMRRL